MAIEKASVTLKLSTTEWALLRSSLESQAKYHLGQVEDPSNPAAIRAVHRTKAAQIEDLLMRLA